MESWDKLPLDLMDELAVSETYRRDVYRPIYSLHKWWARRPGSTFRCLGLASLTDETVMKDDILRQTPQSGSPDGMYINLDDKRIDNDATVLDPFAGGGTTIVELNRLGADVIGYELNPVAWWTTKKSTDDVNLNVLKSEFERVLEETREELSNLGDTGEINCYSTTDPETGTECEVLYYFQSQRIPCLTCKEEVQLFTRYQLAETKKTRPGALYCPNQVCDDRIIELKDRSKGLDKGDKVNLADGGKVTVSEYGNEVCPNCGREFDPKEGTYGYGKYTCSNGHKHDVKETLKRLDKCPVFDRFALQYVGPRGDKRIKEFDVEDAKRVEKAREKLEELREGIPIPGQKIPDGDKTGALLNYNYEKFNELFTDRHLLTIGLLFQKAWDVREKKFENADAQNVAEFLITAVSNTIRFNSKLCKWQYQYCHGYNVFDRHAYVPKVQPVEANPLNSEGTIASFSNAFNKVFEAKQYCIRPFEKIKNPVSGDVEQFYIDNESVSENRVSGLICKTAERLEESDESVDYVITDPPYYDNVQYSELSDYFYIWLRENLQIEYKEFEPDLVPKAREIVANKSADKDERFFVEALSNVFSECNRVLKPHGEMVFTYHHNENAAWSVILKALIDSGFTITGAYPVQSEFSNNMHISDVDNAEYDILIFANKESANEQISLHKLQENLHFELQDIIDEERNRHENLSEADLGVILRGKCMYYYSKHYPDVYREGEQVSVDEALDAVDENIQQVIDNTVNLPRTIDPLSKAYAALYQRCNTHGPESYDDLNKHLLARNLNVSDLEAENLIKGPRGKKEPVSADSRTHHIEGKFNGATPKGANENLLDIDKVHYLYNLYKTDQNTTDYLKAWKDNNVVELADFMAEVTGDDRYSQVMEMTLAQY